jgi:thiol-disulfide isomerase/thioredoxin
MADLPPAGAPGRAPQPRRRLLATAGVAVAAGLAGLGLARLRQPGAAADAAGTTPAGDDLAALWALTLVRPEGGELVLAGLRGKPLLVNFWATWCAPCLRELPEIDRFHREFGPRGWQVLGLAIDGPTPVREFLTRVKLGFPIGLAGLDGTDLVRGLGNPQGGLPFSVMIGAQGRVLQRKIGETHFDELAGWAAKA